MKEDGTFELGDPVKLVGRDNPYVGMKGIFIEYRRPGFQETRVVVRLDENTVEREHSFSQLEVEFDREI